MTPEWIIVIEQVQSHYVDQYANWVEAQLQREGPNSPEVAFQLQSESALFGNLARVDFVQNASGRSEVVPFWPDYALNFEPVSGQMGEAQIHIEPFVWSQAVITIEGARWEGVVLDPWFNDWFGLESGREAQAAPGQPGGMIHSVSISEDSLHVDFGSAPPECLIELVELAERGGASRLAISNDSAGEEAAGRKS